MSDKIITESELMGKCVLPEMEKKGIENEAGKEELGKENSGCCSVRIAESNGTNLRENLSNAKDLVEVSLSEGEASTGFETVSSLESNIDPEDFDLSSTADEDDFNVVVEIENELALQSHRESHERTFYWRNTRKTSDGYECRTKGDSVYLKKHDFPVVNKKQKFCQLGVKHKNFECDEYKDKENSRDESFSERRAFFCKRQNGVPDHNWSGRKNQWKHFNRQRSDHNSRQRHSRSNDREFRTRSIDRDSRARRSRSSDKDSLTRNSRSSEYDSRARGSEGSSECDYRRKRSRSGDSDYTPKYRRNINHRSRTYRSSERNIRHNSPGYKGRRKLRKRSRSFGRDSPSFDRGSPRRKRRRSSHSKSPTSSVWKRLESRPSDTVNREKKSRNLRRKKERTPFLVELERKLKEAERLKESKKDNINGSSVKPEVSIGEPVVANVLCSTSQLSVPPPNLVVPEMQPRTILNSITSVKPRLPRIDQNMITQPTFTQPLPSIPRLGVPFHFTVPEVSVDNLPLVVGPTGLPVHITLTGEQIPHDMDGRRIPVGPNGYYLPLDPTGRLFPHIISPGNEAVPIHMTDDGVLRLPNSEPVPYGPLHKFPVDIDGIIIPIGPDSRPLFPCPDLPRQPPLNILNMIGAEPILPPNLPQATPEAPETANPEIVPSSTMQQIDNIELPPPPTVPPSTPRTLGDQEIRPLSEVHLIESIEHPPPPKKPRCTTETSEMGNQEIIPSPEVQQTADIGNHGAVEAPKIDSALVEIIQNALQKINKVDLLKKYKKKALERTEDILKCKEIEKNLGVNPSKGGVKRSTPMKFSQKKTSRKTPDKEDCNTTITDMVLASDDSDSDLKPGQKPKKGEVGEILLSLDEEQDILSAICDTETSKTPLTSAVSTPKDAIAKKVQQAIKSLRERNYKPPVVGRFIISCRVDPVVRKSPNQSPLLRNRVVLPFITPSAEHCQTADHSPDDEKTEITFKFLPLEVEKGKTPSSDSKSGRSQEKSAVKIPVFTFDFAMQCDFTSVIIKNLNSKIAELEMEVVKLKNINANLIDSYRNVQAMNEKKSGELRKALLDIQERNQEIQALKSSLVNK